MTYGITKPRGLPLVLKRFWMRNIPVRKEGNLYIANNGRIKFFSINGLTVNYYLIKSKGRTIISPKTAVAIRWGSGK